jgi:hypothetical protein
MIFLQRFIFKLKLSDSILKHIDFFISLSIFALNNHFLCINLIHIIIEIFAGDFKLFHTFYDKDIKIFVDIMKISNLILKSGNFIFVGSYLFSQINNLCFLFVDLINIFSYLSSIFLILFNLKLFYRLLELLNSFVFICIESLEIDFLIAQFHIYFIYFTLSLHFIGPTNKLKSYWIFNW